MSSSRFAIRTGLIVSVFLTTIPAAPRQAIRSDHFVEHIGVVTHFGYYDTPYGTRKSECFKLLDELGIRYVRDGADSQKRVQQLYDSLGIKVLMVTSASNSPLWDTTHAAACVQLLHGFDPRMVLAIEGTNEFNVSGRATWASEVRDFTRRLHAAVRADSVYGRYPIVGPTLSEGRYGDVKDLSPWVDFGGLHWYSAGIEPSHGEFNYFGWHYDNCKTHMFPGKKIWITETGYHNALSTNWAASEATAAKYIPRTYMWMLYDMGVERVFTYEFLNEWVNTANDNVEAHWGLVRNDLSKKPAFTALKNCITLLSDPDTCFVPVPLEMTLSGETANVHSVLFQKKSGTYLLALWQEARSYDPAAKQEIAVAQKTVTLTLGASASVKQYKPCDPSSLNNGTTAFASSTGSTVSLSVPDHLLFVEINNGAILTANVPPVIRLEVPASGLRAKTGSAIALEASAFDCNGSVAKVEFFGNTSKIGEKVATPFTYTWSPASEGTYSITAVASDNAGGKDTSDAVVVTVMNNFSPQVTLVAPANNAMFALGKPITIAADARDENGSVARVEFFRDGAKIGEDATSPFSFSWTGAPAGVSKICARVIDNQGAAVASDTSTIRITDHVFKLEVVSGWNYLNFVKVRRNGTWDSIFCADTSLRYNHFGFHGAGWAESNTPGASAQIGFSGTGFRFYGGLREWGGSGKIWFDGVYVKDVGFDSATSQDGVLLFDTTFAATVASGARGVSDEHTREILVNTREGLVLNADASITPARVFIYDVRGRRVAMSRIDKPGPCNLGMRPAAGWYRVELEMQGARKGSVIMVR